MVVSVTVVLLILAGCTGGGSGERSPAPTSTPTTSTPTASTPTTGTPTTGTPTASTPTAPSPEPDPLAGLPAVPAGRPAVLAGHLEAVVGVLSDRGADTDEVRRAARYQQLAARWLATEPAPIREGVLQRLRPAARDWVRLDVEAAGLLDAMTTPQRSLPEWRVVAPPPVQVLLGHYRYAEERVGVPWHHLAAIHLVETRMGRIRGTSTAGARGPMQFLPATWERYGDGGDIKDPRDSVLAAARLLRANGAPTDMARAFWHYNPHDNYVGAVRRYSEQMRRSPLAYRAYWHWQVLYKHVGGIHVLRPGYPGRPAELL